MAHTSEEQWYKSRMYNNFENRETLRKDVLQYYKVRKIARMIQSELGIRTPPSVDTYSFKNGAMREMAQSLRRSIYAIIEREKKRLGLFDYKDLTAHQRFMHANAWESRVMTHSRYYKRDVPALRREIMSVEELAERMNKMMNRDQEPDFVFPKYYRELVTLKGINVASGSARFKWSPTAEGRDHYSGPLVVCHAREIKADWLEEDNIRAFKVVVLPERDRSVYYSADIGYVARSSITDDIDPAFGEDIAKAVSLCRRRVKAKVMKQMGI